MSSRQREPRGRPDRHRLLSLAVAAYEKLTGEGVRSRVVSLPSCHRFELQDRAYRDSVLPPAVTARLANSRWLARSAGTATSAAKGDTITMSTFGASAPISKLQDKFGFTVDNVVKVAKGLIQ